MAQTEKSPADLARLVWKVLTSRSLPVPGARVLTTIFGILFFTSLKTEELEPIRCSITYLDPHDPDPAPPPRIRHSRWRVYRFSERVAFTVRNLSKLARAMDPTAASLAVYSDSAGKCFIWGVVDQYPMHSSRFMGHESESGPQIPGLFNAVITGIGELAVWRGYGLLARLKQSSLLTQYHDVLHFGPIAERMGAYAGGYVEAVTEQLQASNLPLASPELMSYLNHYWRSILARLLIAVRNYRHGGALLILPQDVLRDGLKQNYKLPYSRLREALVKYGVTKSAHLAPMLEILEQYGPKSEPVPYQLQAEMNWFLDENNDCRAAIAGAIAMIASLTRIDGLVLLDGALNVEAFGVEILAEKDISQLYVANGATASGRQLRDRDPQNYGTRHRSMMRYCAEHPKSVGFVVSQDGDVRAIVNLKGKVVMWENIQLQLNLDHEERINKTQK